MTDPSFDDDFDAREWGLDDSPEPCEACGERDVLTFNGYCGVYVCCACDHHKGLARCYCGWSKSGGDGRRELIEMGEVI